MGIQSAAVLRVGPVGRVKDQGGIPHDWILVGLHGDVEKDTDRCTLALLLPWPRDVLCCPRTLPERKPLPDAVLPGPLPWTSQIVG